MTFPNTFGAKPGEKLNFLSFDHTTGRLVIEGSATVSADGLSVSTDPSTGITHPGWHGLTPQGSPTRPDPPDPKKPAGSELSFSITQTLVPVDPQPQAAARVNAQQSFSDWLLTDNTQRVRFEAKNTTNLAAENGSDLMVSITVDPTIAHTYLDGLRTDTFVLRPGQTKLFDFTLKSPNIKKLANDVLIGAKYNVEVFQLVPGDVTTKLDGFGDFYVYRYVDALDSDASDGIIEFPDTLADGAGKRATLPVRRLSG